MTWNAFVLRGGLFSRWTFLDKIECPVHPACLQPTSPYALTMPGTPLAVCSDLQQPLQWSASRPTVVLPCILSFNYDGHWSRCVQFSGAGCSHFLHLFPSAGGSSVRSCPLAWYIKCGADHCAFLCSPSSQSLSSVRCSSPFCPVHSPSLTTKALV